MASRSRVVDVDREVHRAFADDDLQFERSWGDCQSLTPRQAYAMASTLALWADDIREWLDGGWSREPLHEVSPFSGLDRRVMIYVNDNKAWAAKAQERCYAVADQIAEGVLPFDRQGCYFDELLMALALPTAEAHLTATPEVFEGINPRLPFHKDEIHSLGDDEWTMVGDDFDDRCRWDEWHVPVYNDHPLLGAILAERHPYTWFDASPGTGGAYLHDLANTVNEQAPG